MVSSPADVGRNEEAELAAARKALAGMNFGAPRKVARAPMARTAVGEGCVEVLAKGALEPAYGQYTRRGLVSYEYPAASVAIPKAVR